MGLGRKWRGLAGVGRRRRLGAAAVLAAASVLLTAAPSSGSGTAPLGHPLDPARFARGACVVFAPIGGRARATVFIDAGHGGPDPGAVGVTLGGRSVHEADETVRVALDALAPLRAAGFRVVLSRTGAGAVARPAPGDLDGGLFTAQGVHRDLVARDACANRARAAVLIGVYFNANDSPAAAGGLTLYDAARPFWRKSLRLARLVQDEVLASLRAAGAGVPDDGVHTDVGYGSSVSAADQAYGHLLILGPAKRGYFSAPSRMPGALIEPLFITDPAEASLAASRRGQMSIARGLARAVERYFGPPAAG
jgi:N-acetylmuramoyl-L-alanine amidase